MWVTGLPGQGPIRAGAAVADISAGLYATIGILIALNERERSGVGQWIQTSLLQAQIAILDFQAARYLVDGVVPPQAGNDHPYSTPMGVFETADGFINLAVGGDGQWRSLCKVLGRPELGKAPEFATGGARAKNRPQVREVLEPHFRQKTSAEWLALLAEAAVPVGPIYKMDEVFADPQVTHLGIAVPTTHPVRGEMRLVGQPVGLSRTPASIRAPAPDAGSHTDEILGELGMAADEIAALRDDRIV